jgi:hypothetical protein
MQIQSHKTVFFDDGNVNVSLEPSNEGMMIHCTVEEMSPSVMKLLYRKFIEVQDFLSEKNIYSMFTVSPNIRFCEMFNGELVKTILWNNKEYGVIRWDWKPQPLH